MTTEQRPLWKTSGEGKRLTVQWVARICLSEAFLELLRETCWKLFCVSSGGMYVVDGKFKSVNLVLRWYEVVLKCEVGKWVKDL